MQIALVKENKNVVFMFMRHAVGDSTGAYFPSVGCDGRKLCVNMLSNVLHHDSGGSFNQDTVLKGDQKLNKS